MELIALRVWRPDDTTVKVTSIASHEENIGNKIADGSVSKEDYWPMLVDAYRCDANREFKERLAVEQELRELRDGT